MIRARLFILAAASLFASTCFHTPVAPASKPESIKTPFRVGERLSYQAKVNFVNAGSASMSVEGLVTVRGRATYHTIFDVRGKVLFFKVNDHYESWFDTTT